MGRRGAGYSYGVTILPLPACYREDTPPECVQFHLLPPVGGILGVFAQSLPWVGFPAFFHALCDVRPNSHRPSNYLSPVSSTTTEAIGSGAFAGVRTVILSLLALNLSAVFGLVSRYAFVTAFPQDGS